MSRSAGRTSTILSLACLLLAACETRPVVAPEKTVMSAEEKAAGRSIVWLKEGALDDDIEGVKILQDTIFPAKLAVYDSFNGSFALDMSPEQAAALIEEATDKDRILKVIDHIEPDSVIYAFQLPRAGCTVTAGLPAAGTPMSITRVGGPICTAAGCPAPTKKVWLLDTGVDKDYDDRQLVLDNQNAADCTPNNCRTGLVDANDTDGHGTAIAGIIAGRVHDGQGLQGVAPGATIVPVKIMNSSTGTAEGLMIDALNGLHYVKQKRQQNVAKAGDVVSISWGAAAHFTGYQMAVEDVVHDLADLDMKVVIAAGNLMPFTDPAKECNPDEAHAPGGGLVGSMVPARAGSYSPGGSGGVWTVSAVAVSTVGSDAPFWFHQPPEQCPDPDDGGPAIGRTRSPYGSFFGNDVTFGTAPADDAPPDFAEPGVSIPTLWINDQAAVCTGTSFAVPHLAGILLHSGNPDEGGRSVGDPGAVTSGAPDPTKEDPIGVCKTSHPGCTYP